ncbi:putative mediator of RNA polymerase II transcription subunit 26 [Dendroctonus ponderosae]|uniref:putative mediator of RNA polymerase II transcription subunit 26 n=1 Tax=Dendroctonus ponderosae TaxID=77166 RepID=UPI00203640D5|nr:putative mediator of RNA polymerase II transcription subunit 26 [Dendroctonus ponderosae]KAH1027644.1 hypothetical protein HUJ05_001119 [Dendroctonus ponderosae]
MSRLPIRFLLLHICWFAIVHSSGVLIKSGVVKNQGEAQNENVEDVKFQKGIANFEEEEGFNKDDEKKSVVAQDSGRFGEQSANKKAHVDANNFQKENFHQNAGDQRGNVDTKVAHHKGHHKSGFTNSYHKDETGSNSSYFDDGSDDAGQIEHKNYRETYGDAGQHKQGGGKYDSAEFANDQARRGQYDNNGRYEKDYGNQRNYNRNNYYDGKENLARRNLGNSYEGGARFAEQQYAHGPAYYPAPLPYRRPLPPPPPPLPQDHHITIYEDPRYVRSDPRYRRSDDYIDDVNLEIRNPLDRDRFDHYYNNPSKDYVYYD